MKEVIISADVDSVVYSVPDQESTFVRNLGWTDLGKDIPDEYKDLPYFNF